VDPVRHGLIALLAAPLVISGTLAHGVTSSTRAVEAGTRASYRPGALAVPVSSVRSFVARPGKEVGPRGGQAKCVGIPGLEAR
jgi:hypothetical protein